MPLVRVPRREIYSREVPRRPRSGRVRAEALECAHRRRPQWPCCGDRAMPRASAAFTYRCRALIRQPARPEEVL
ncbi:hypothetical protein [Lysobacter gummosus]|uniref:hypothetical protein n=1 Tax=Lysobacter gummosus TaxID=262324 RepID=UPI003631A436